MLHRKSNPAPVILSVFLFLIVIGGFYVTDRNHQDTRKEIDDLQQRIEQLQREMDSLKAVHQRFRGIINESEVMLSESIFQLDLHQSKWLSLLESIKEEAALLEKKMQELRKMAIEEEANLQVSHEELKKILQDHQDNLQEVQLPPPKGRKLEFFYLENRGGYLSNPHAPSN